MNLVIRAVTLNDQPLSQAIVGCFDAKGGTIGRSDANTMTLPDPERHISRLQVEVLALEGRFHVHNAASANPIFVNGRALNPGERGVLANHDELRIGGYALDVLMDVDDEAVRTITHGRAVVDARAVIAGSAAEHRTDPRQMMQGRGARVVPPLPVAPPSGIGTAMPPAPPTGAGGPPSMPAAAGSNPFDDLLGRGSSPASADDPFADLLGSATPSTPANDPFSFVTPPAAAPAPRAQLLPGGAPARLPDDFDPFADLAPPPVKAAPATARVGANDLLGSVGAGSGTPLSIDASFGLGSVDGAADPLASFLSGPAPGAAGAKPAHGLESTDPFAMFGPASGSPAAAAGPAVFNHTPELKAAYKPPPVVTPRAEPAAPPTEQARVVASAPVAAPPPSEPLSPAPDSSVDVLFADLGLSGSGASADPFVDLLGAPAAARAPEPMPPADAPMARSGPGASARPAIADSAPRSPDALWAAFCEGAGLSTDRPQNLTPERMRVLGLLMREATEGTLRLMAVRATAKNELRATVTTIRTRNNNPLKFSPNAQAALEQLLQPPLRGFMAGPAAMQDAMHDLVGHCIGTMAGMRAALAGVLGRFEPADLERKLIGTSLMDSLLPMNRKAKLWDLYLQHFGTIRDAAQEDFHELFGAAFVAAYEEQLDRLQPPGADAGAGT
jgi:FHA domain-containing protein